MLSGWFLWFIILWVLFLIVMFSIGGFFMFRKFLKIFPKADGKSELDWQDYYIKKTSHLWPSDIQVLLEELVHPVPEMFRDVARSKIVGKIGQLALEEKASTISEDLFIRGYISATPKRDLKFLLKMLKRKNIDTERYSEYFNT